LDAHDLLKVVLVPDKIESFADGLAFCAQGLAAKKKQEYSRLSVYLKGTSAKLAAFLTNAVITVSFMKLLNEFLETELSFILNGINIEQQLKDRLRIHIKSLLPLPPEG